MTLPPLPHPATNRVYLSHCHDEQNPGKTTADGWSERRLAKVVNESIEIALRERPQITCWPVYRGTLADRIKTFQSLPPAPLVEVHFDWLPRRPQLSGYFALANERSQVSQELGESILDAIAGAFPERRSLGLCLVNDGRRWIGTHREYDGIRLALLEELPAYPVVILEACYLSNPGDAAWIKRLETRLALGAAIGQGIRAYLHRRTPTIPTIPSP